MEREAVLTKTKYTVGRLPENDIELPDDLGIITRIEHCILEREASGWWLTDQSTNGTVVQREGQRVAVDSFPLAKVQIGSGDIIYIHTWELAFHDPNRTNPLKSFSVQPKSVSRFVFNLSQLTLYKIVQNRQEKVELRPQVRKMFGYMAQKNLENNNQPILCKYNELIHHIWEGDAFGKTNQDINTLASEIRELLTDKSLLETVKREGYILHIACDR